MRRLYSHQLQGIALEEYKTALSMYWGGRLQTSIEYLTNLLADNPDHSAKFELYRLWLEILAQSKESERLQNLCQHLLQLAQNNRRDASIFMSLRGIIHLELDELEAAELYYNILNQQSIKDAHVFEFLKRYEYRFLNLENQKRSFNINRIQDYLTLQYICNYEFMSQEWDKYKSTLKRINQIFQGNPLARTQQFHYAWQNTDYNTATAAAAWLSNKFPGHQDHLFYLGAAQVFNDDLISAISSLNKARLVCGNDDIDINCLLASIYGELALSSDDENFEQIALPVLQSANDLLLHDGMENPHLKNIYKKIKNRGTDMQNEHGNSQRGVEMQGNEKQKATQRVWLVQLTSREFSKIKTDSIDEIQDLTIGLGFKVMKGDLILLGKMFSINEDMPEMRVAALYEAVTDPYYDPQQQICTEVTLVHRPELSVVIPLDVEEGEQHAIRRVYELDDLALEEISYHLEERLSNTDCNYWKSAFATKRAG